MSDKVKEEMDALGLPWHTMDDDDVSFAFALKAANEHHGDKQSLLELHAACDRYDAEIARLRDALIRLRDCDWVITLPDRMDAVREIAREALDPKA